MCVCACKAEERQRRKRYMCVLVSLPSHPVSLSRSPRDATTPNPTDRLRVISLSLLARSQILIGVQPSRCTMWHQQSCATRTRPCGGLRDLEKMSQKKTCLSPLVAALCVARARRTKRRKHVCSRFPARIMDALFESAFEND